MTTERIVGAFRLMSLLGRGSSGEVYLAERVESFTQRVAIKLLEPRDCGSESDTLLALDHPYIVKVMDRGDRYFAMEYVNGVALDVFCATRSSRERLSLLIKIAAALSYAHRHLVVHADLKPSNILVTPDGEPKLLDFGGGHTPRFASPEQLDQQPLSAASDIYSLGMLARSLFDHVGRDLQAVLDTATRREPAERYASMDAFAADLQSILDGREVTVRKTTTLGRLARWSLRHRWRSATLALVTVTLVFATVAVINDAIRAAKDRARTQAQLERLVALTGELQGDLYESAARLPHSEAARKILLEGARRTLAQLAAQHIDDPVLNQELARQQAQLEHLTP